MKRLGMALGVLFLAAMSVRAGEPPEGWLRKFRYKPEAFEAKVEERAKQDAWVQYKVGFPSPVTSDVEVNNTVDGYYVEPRKQNIRAAVIILPIWKGSNPELELAVARRLAQDGIAAFVMALPYQFNRAPKGVHSGSMTVSSNLERTQDVMRQAIQDIQRTADWLVNERRIPEDRLGVMGTSLGGHVAALAWAVCPRFKAACTILAGGNVHELFWNPSYETKEIKEELDARGVTLDQLKAATAPFDAISYARPNRKEGLLMIAAKDDPVVPIDNARSLRDAFGGPRLIVYPGNHYSVIVNLNGMLDDVTAHFRQVFGEMPK